MHYIIDGGAPIEVTRIGRIRYVDNWNIKGHKSASHRIIFVLQGKILYTINGNQYTLTKGDYVIIPKDAFYASFIEESCEFYYLHFSPSCMQAVSDDTAKAMQNERLQKALDAPALPYNKFAPCSDYNIYLTDSASTGEHFSSIVLLINKCESCCLNRTPENKMLLNLRMQRLILKLSEITQKAENESDVPPVLLRITAFIQENYTTDITLTGLSEQFSLSKQYIIRLFKKHLGTTVTKYINMMRLERALELLRHSSLNVSEIAAFLGYHSVYYFCRIFKAYYHITPTCYIQGKADADLD